MAAFPQFVPRLELDVHLRSIDERLSDIAKQISTSQEQQERSRCDLEVLNGILGGHASKHEVNHLGSRLDLQIACTDATVTEGLETLREHTDSEVKVLREEMKTQIEALQASLSKASSEIVAVSDALAKEAASKELYATKSDQNIIRSALESSRDQMHAQLKSAIDTVDRSKASYNDLDAAVTRLSSDDDKVFRNITKLTEEVTQTSQNLTFFDQLCRSTFATRNEVIEMSASIESLRQRTREIADERVDVQALLENERVQMQNRVGEFQDLQRVLNQASYDIHDLQENRKILADRCDKNEQELRYFQDAQKVHQDEFQAAMVAQMKANEELRNTSSIMRGDMEMHISDAKRDNEKLRQYSTMRYFDQLDKALAFQETVERVQRDNQELSESMRSINAQ